MHGGTVCWSHGGAAGQVRAKAAARLALAKAEAQVTKVLSSEPHLPIDNPYAALSDLTSEVVHMKDVVGGMVNDLQGRLRYTATGAGTEQLRAEVALLERAQDRAGKFLDLMIRSRVEEKRLALDVARAKIQGEHVGRFLDQILAGLDLSPRQRALIPLVLPPALRALGSGQPLPTTFHDGLEREWGAKP